jgi:hypothetical protein
VAAPPIDPAALPPPVTSDRRNACPNCGEPAEPGQEICLRCGARVARDYRRPPGWRVPAALAALGVLLIGAGAGFGVAELTHKKARKKEPISLTPIRPVTPVPTRTVTAPPPTTTPTGPSGPNGAATGPSGPTGATGGAKPNETLTSWPTGHTGWTVILASSKDRAQAAARARSAAKHSISAGVIRTDSFKHLPRATWMAFMGQYDSKKAASRAQKRYASQGYKGSPLFLQPK